MSYDYLPCTQVVTVDGGLARWRRFAHVVSVDGVTEKTQRRLRNVRPVTVSPSKRLWGETQRSSCLTP
jgi:hypothetical protein